jgi:CHAT domain-containing protein
VNLAVRGPGDEDLDVYRRRLVAARQEGDSAEAALARASAAFRAERARNRYGWRDVAASLPPGAALVAYVRHAEVVRSEARATKPLSSYGVFVARHGELWPTFTSLGDAGSLDSLVVTWRMAASGYGVEEAGYRRAGAALRERIWDPIESRLEGTRTLFMVPDGMLGLVNHATLPTGAAGYLLESEAPFHYLAGERGLVDERPARGEPGELLAVGGVDYESHGLPEGTPRGRRVPGSSRSAGATRRGMTMGAAPGDCVDLPVLDFVPLPETRREVGDVCAIWETARQHGVSRTLIGSNATEHALRSLAPRARALHLATHGFFVDPSCSERSRATAAGPPPAVDANENPMVRTGLALAGANRKDRTAQRGDDGILTAAEFAGMDLRGLDWVVLSGCDTGAGTPASLEGLLGLRRAFEVSGAGTVIMSLWGIEDAPARRWTRALYGARFLHGRSPSEAVQEASLTLLRAQRKAGMGGHPGAWGSFVASGSWR